MRPAELGTVRLMNLIADCSTTQGSSGSGVGTAPRNDTPPAMKVSWAMITPTTIQATSALRNSSAIVPNPIFAS